METLDLGNLLVHLKADASQYKAVMNSVEGRFISLSTKMQKVGFKMSLALSVPIVSFATASVKAFANFDDAMTKSLAILDGVTPKIRKEMEDLALNISGKSTSSATELAKAYFYLASAGMDAKQSMASLKIVEEFAIAGNFDLSKATELLAGSQAALGLDSKNAAEHMKNMVRVSDTLVAANVLSQATTEEFAAALGTESASAMKVWGIQVEEGVAVLAAYAKQNTKGEKAGSDFGRMLRMTMKNYMEQRDVWMKMGIAIYDTQGKLLPIADIIETLTNKFGRLASEMKAAALAQLGFEARSQQVILPLLGMQDNIREYEMRLRSMSGFSKDVAEKNMQSFSAQLKIVKNQFVNVGISIGSYVAPILRSFAVHITNLTVWWGGLNEHTKQFIVYAGLIVAAIGPVILIVKYLTWTFYTLAKSQAVVLALSGPKGWAQLAIGAAIAAGAILLINDMMDTFGKTSESATDKAINGFKDMQKEAKRNGPLSSTANLEQFKRQDAELAKEMKRQSEITELAIPKLTPIIRQFPKHFNEKTGERIKSHEFAKKSMLAGGLLGGGIGAGLSYIMGKGIDEKIDDKIGKKIEAIRVEAEKMLNVNNAIKQNSPNGIFETLFGTKELDLQTEILTMHQMTDATAELIKKIEEEAEEAGLTEQALLRLKMARAGAVGSEFDRAETARKKAEDNTKIFEAQKEMKASLKYQKEANAIIGMDTFDASIQQAIMKANDAVDTIASSGQSPFEKLSNIGVITTDLKALVDEINNAREATEKFDESKALDDFAKSVKNSVKTAEDYLYDLEVAWQTDRITQEEYFAAVSKLANDVLKDTKEIGVGGFGSYNSKTMDLSAFQNTNDPALRKQDTIIRNLEQLNATQKRIETKEGGTY